MGKKELINLIGNILMLLSFAFIIDKVMKYEIRFRVFHYSFFLILLFATVVYACIVIAYANIYFKLLRILSSNDISKNNSIYIYCKSNLYKYLPGNIFHYLGRNQIAINERLEHSTLISTTIIEMMLLLIAGLISATAFSGKYAIRWIFNNYTCEGIILVIVIIIIICSFFLLFFHLNLRIRSFSIRYIELIKQIKLKDTIVIIMVYITIFIINGIVFLMILYSSGISVNKYLIASVIGMHIFSWIVGFITPGAPAGLGVREAIMSAMLLGIVQESQVVAAVVIYRVVTIFGDIFGFILSYRIKRIKK